MEASESGRGVAESLSRGGQDLREHAATLESGSTDLNTVQVHYNPIAQRLASMPADLLGDSGGAIAELEILRGDLVGILYGATRGDVEYLINRTDNSWIVTLLNNNGVYKSQQGMAQVDRNAYVNVAISLRSDNIQSASDWINDAALKVDANNLNLRIAPGGIAVVELRTK